MKSISQNNTKKQCIRFPLFDKIILLKSYIVTFKIKKKN